ncbi:adenylate/guanylate cyclase domain-containing protein [Leptospira ognonensis]|uniref:Adenylate/guanylate cyclase domain-containing protein n=1 Tax=Leptospira ognonensis TaxID=2484945 RepID=A0A4R9K766_9LEPT|nr:adenylate/guanylate cyclase domain-containing protein [Leptospira ognonensis]TGL62149.1 adenylate/guanylate cyclase domain-containing protein [Leptospira ognonensis]
MKIEYLNECTIESSESGDTILAIALSSSKNHTHECGGHARCSTCRVLVLSGEENLGPRTTEEKTLAEAKGFPSEIRLACQTKVYGDIKIRRLVIDRDDIETAYGERGVERGSERKVAILFSDIRGFTNFSERNLAYDVVHILNRYFKKVGDTVLKNHGYIDKFMGDGMMCLFGLNETDPKKICHDAVTTAIAMQRELSTLNEYLKQQFFGEEFKIGIGIHFGEVILGEIGHPEKHQVTAIGDNVNQASRIETATKKAKAYILISEEVKEHLSGQFQYGRTFQAKLKGKSGHYRLREVMCN